MAAPGAAGQPPGGDAASGATGGTWPLSGPADGHGGVGLGTCHGTSPPGAGAGGGGIAVDGST
jgi:hypothetical protein